jgi:phage shock protein C
MNNTDGTKTLVRSRNGRMVAGICAGAAGYFGWDVTVVRVVVVVVSVLTGGTGVLAYLVAWAVIPAEGEKTSIAEDLIGSSRHDTPG